MNDILKNGLPNIFFTTEEIKKLSPSASCDYAKQSNVNLDQLQASFGLALHMHQPTIPAGGGDLQHAGLISNLQHMLDNQGIGDNHNASVFIDCYGRMGNFIPDLVSRGKNPRIMLDYSGNLLWGIRQMGLDDTVEKLRRIACDKRYIPYVEWLGTTWSHAVATSTPVPDLKLHIMAWRKHFAELFGIDAVRRVKGFSPPEMHLPIHPDQCYEYIKALKECGYQWLMVQEHTIENPDGSGIRRPHLPHRLVAKNSKGETQEIVVLVKTQGSDTKLVAQMQPYYEARGLGRVELGGRLVPPLVTQIADGENGGVMMNEFPPKYHEVMRECSGSETPVLGGTEYLDQLAAMGVTERDFPVIQPLFQRRIWEAMKPGDGPERLEAVIEELRRADGRFHMEGGSWTNNLSWVRGYDNLPGPLDRLSARFAQVAAGTPPGERRYRNALFHLMTAQTSCYRYWGQGTWTDYGLEIIRRADEILSRDF